MIWGKPERYFQQTKDGWYSVAKIGETDPKYEAWKTRRHPEGPHCLAVNLPSAAEARARCEADAP